MSVADVNSDVHNAVMASTDKAAGPTGRRAAGPTSQRLIDNLRRWRKRRDVSTYGLADRLKEIDWPIQQSGLTRIERAERRVDVDDLIALAVALDVSPNALLLPGPLTPMTALGHQEPLTPTVMESLGRMWAWATGEQPLTPGTGHDTAEFIMDNRPHRFQLSAAPDSAVWNADSDMRALIYRALSAGVAPWQLRTMFEQSMTATMNTPKVFGEQD